MKKLYFLMLAAMIMIAGNAMAQKDSEHPWAGTYTLMLADDTPFHSLPESAAEWNVLTPDTFEVTIEWNAELSQYRVTKFYDMTTENLTDGSFELKVIDEKNAQIILVKEAYHVFGIQPAGTVVSEDGEEVTYENDTKVKATLTDGGNNTWSYEPIAVFMNSDGQISIDAFKVLYSDRSNMGWIVWTDGAVPLNGGDEPVAVEPRDWTGTYTMTVPDYYCMALDGNEYPNQGAFEIAKDDNGNFIVTKFLGYDTALANAFFSGGIYLTPSKKNVNKATIDCDEYMNLLESTEGMGMAGLVLCDGAAANGPINIEWNEETQTISFDMFYFMHWDGMSGEAPTEAILYIGADAVKNDPNAITGITKKDIVKGIYDLSGHRVTSPQKGHLYIINGKKVIK